MSAAHCNDHIHGSPPLHVLAGINSSNQNCGPSGQDSARESTSAATVTATAVALTGDTRSVSTMSPTTAASAPAATARATAPAMHSLPALVPGRNFSRLDNIPRHSVLACLRLPHLHAPHRAGTQQSTSSV